MKKRKSLVKAWFVVAAGLLLGLGGCEYYHQSIPDYLDFWSATVAATGDNLSSRQDAWWDGTDYFCVETGQWDGEGLRIQMGNPKGAPFAATATITGGAAPVVQDFETSGDAIIVPLRDLKPTDPLGNRIDYTVSVKWRRTDSGVEQGEPYVVRLKQRDKPDSVYVLSEDSYNFGVVTEGYDPFSPRTVTVTNIDPDQTLRDIDIGNGTGDFDFGISEFERTLEPGESTRFTVTPKADLTSDRRDAGKDFAGSLGLRVTASGGKTYDLTYAAKLTVNPPSYTVTLPTAAAANAANVEVTLTEGGSPFGDGSTVYDDANLTLSLKPKQGFSFESKYGGVAPTWDMSGLLATVTPVTATDGSYQWTIANPRGDLNIAAALTSLGKAASAGEYTVKGLTTGGQNYTITLEKSGVPLTDGAKVYGIDVLTLKAEADSGYSFAPDFGGTPPNLTKLTGATPQGPTVEEDGRIYRWTISGITGDQAKELNFATALAGVAATDLTKRYVGGTGTSDTNPGTEAKPFATVQKAVDYFKNLSASHPSTATNPYTIRLLGDVTNTDSLDTADNTALVNVAPTSPMSPMNLVIESHNGGAYTIDAARTSTDYGRVMHVGKNASVTLRNVTLIGGDLTGGTVANSGGGVWVNGGNLTLEGGAVIKDNHVSANGGGVLVQNGGSLTMNGGEISDNTAGDSGGGVRANDATFTMIGGTISGNTATKDGGGVRSERSFIMTGGEISGNEASGNGGGVYIYGGSFTMDGTATISGNKETKDGGGGVYVTNNGKFTMNGGTIGGDTPDAANTSITQGAGVCINGGTFEMTGGKITGNNATREGGGVYIRVGEFTMSGGSSTISNNTPGGVCVFEGCTFTMNGGTVSGNSGGSNGGGVFVWDTGTFNLSGGTISGNTATNSGGGVYVKSDAKLTMSGGSISGNTATTNGDGVFNEGEFTMSGGASVADNNDVYLTTNKVITVTDSLNPPTGTAATITPPSYTVGTQVLDLSAVAGQGMEDKFDVSTLGWNINTDGRLYAGDFTSTTATDFDTSLSTVTTGTHTLEVTGQVDDSNWYDDIFSPLFKLVEDGNTSVVIHLDLSGVTGLTDLPQEAFYNDTQGQGCENLASIILPKVTTINNYVFSGCTNLTQVTFGGTQAEWNAAVGINDPDLPSGCTVTCSDGTITIP